MINMLIKFGPMIFHFVEQSLFGEKRQELRLDKTLIIRDSLLPLKLHFIP